MNTIQEQLAAAETANNTGNYAQAEELCRQLLTHDLQSEEKATVLLYLSESLVRRGATQEALSFAQDALSLTEKLDNTLLQAKICGNIGVIYSNLSEYYLALKYYQQALALSQESKNDYETARWSGNIGNVYYALSNYTRALTALRTALEIGESVGDKYRISIRLGNIGNVYADIGDYSRALEYYQSALSMDKELNNLNGMANNIGNIGNIYYYLRDYNQALEYYQQALSLNKSIHNKNGIANRLGTLGLVHESLLDYTRALEYYTESLHIYEELGNKNAIAIQLGNMGNLYSLEKNPLRNIELAEYYLRQSIAIIEELGTKRHLYEQYRNLADLYKQKASWQEHAKYLQLYYETEKEVQSEEAKKKADQMDYERKEAERDKQRAVELAQADTMEKLLYKTFPSPIVPRLKRGEELVVERFPSISVLFADLVGFTKLSLSIKPEILIEMLNFIFTKFDISTKEAGGHRLRTIGDGYFAICGAPDMVENHQYNLAKAALAMQEDIILPKHIKQELPEGTELDIRIGLHCGEAVCGMVGGLEKWQYDAYGDTINTASRMESHGEPGKIHISEEFKNALAEYDEFIFTPREPMYIKGKGMMNTFFLS